MPSPVNPTSQTNRGFVDPINQPPPANAAEAFQNASRRFAELRVYTAYFVSAKLDQIKLTVRNIAVLAALGIVGLIAGGAVVATAAVLILQGIAGAISALAGGREWVGDLACGILVLAAIAIAIYVVMTRITKTSRSQTVSKYEDRKRQQHSELGADVQERADLRSGN